MTAGALVVCRQKFGAAKKFELGSCPGADSFPLLNMRDSSTRVIKLMLHVRPRSEMGKFLKIESLKDEKRSKHDFLPKSRPK